MMATLRGARQTAPAAAAGGARRPGSSARLSSSSSSSSSSSLSRPLLLPALYSALLLLVLLAAGVGTAAAEGEDGELQPPAVGDIHVGAAPPTKEEEKKRPPEGLYFYLTSKEPRRCFVVTEGWGSIFHVHYDYPNYEKDQEIALELRQLSDHRTRQNRFLGGLVDKNDRKVIDSAEGSHQFTIMSKKDTPHSLCAVKTSTTKTEGRGLKLYLDLDTGMEDKKYDHLKKKFTLEDVQISMIQLKASAFQMLRTADFSKVLETDYHKMLLKVNHEVLWWPVSQVVILIVMGFYQVRHLKKFFKSKRLV